MVLMGNWKSGFRKFFKELMKESEQTLVFEMPRLTDKISERDKCIISRITDPAEGWDRLNDWE